MIPTFHHLPSFLAKTSYQVPDNAANGPVQHALQTDKPFFAILQENARLGSAFNDFMTGYGRARPSWVDYYPVQERLLSRARAIPEILYLYANKPVPQEGSSPPSFSKPSPKAASQAVPADVADEALTAAIEAKDMSLALAVVDHTCRAPAWTRHRTLTKMGIPGVLAAMTPLAIYMIAQELSVYSGFIDPWTFKMYAFAGISTYVMCTGTLGFVALTTYNDDHDRVVWRPGVPLLDRYVRADERAALDRIACAWGFKELWKRGDEEGEEWEGLRQLCLLRGMVLDKSDLLPGMNPGR